MKWSAYLSAHMKFWTHHEAPASKEAYEAARKEAKQALREKLEAKLGDILTELGMDLSIEEFEEHGS